MVIEKSVIIPSPGCVILWGMQYAADKLIESQVSQKVMLVSNLMRMQNFERLVIFPGKYANSQITKFYDTRRFPKQVFIISISPASIHPAIYNDSFHIFKSCLSLRVHRGLLCLPPLLSYDDTNNLLTNCEFIIMTL